MLSGGKRRGQMFGMGKKVREAGIRWFVTGVTRDVSKGEYGKAMQKTWEYLNGRKTAIGLVVTFLPQLAQAIAEIAAAGGGDATAVVKALGYAAVAIGAVHRVLKG